MLNVHVNVDRPLGFDQVVALSGGQVTRDQARSASADLCRDGQLDRIRAGVYQWSAGQRAATQSVLRPRQDTSRTPEPPAANEGAAAADVFTQLFPGGITMTAAALDDLAQWASLTSRLARRGNSQQ